ncbi:YebY family protein [Acinetobacter baumannii]|nr:YebY family protein [Acinetobacter baumannii]
MKKIISLLTVIFLTACSSEPELKKQEVSADQYKDRWPLVVNKGTLTCEPPSRIVFTDPEGNKYGVNGSAQNDYKTIFDITKEAENLGVKFKMNVTPLIEAGSKLCEK